MGKRALPFGRYHYCGTDFLEGIVMCNEEPRVSDTGRYNTTETCKVLGIHRNTLNRWRKAGYINATYRRVDLKRFYTGKDIKKCWRAVL